VFYHFVSDSEHVRRPPFASSTLLLTEWENKKEFRLARNLREFASLFPLISVRVLVLREDDGKIKTEGMDKVIVRRDAAPGVSPLLVRSRNRHDTNHSDGFAGVLSFFFN
jgi:hypothetical protein